MMLLEGLQAQANIYHTRIYNALLSEMYNFLHLSVKGKAENTPVRANSGAQRVLKTQAYLSQGQLHSIAEPEV